MLYSGTFEKYDCQVIGSGVACSYKVNVELTGSTSWYDNYDEFVPKVERLFVDMIFIVLLILTIYTIIKIVRKILF